mmetsp:Transcript_14160/g.38911  ORF Transcript_14160/g.38911 Transcript_14160/m.38911 type:complete len:232 (-) Transcript_14160:43-738(-)
MLIYPVPDAVLVDVTGCTASSSAPSGTPSNSHSVLPRSVAWASRLMFKFANNPCVICSRHVVAKNVAWRSCNVSLSLALSPVSPNLMLLPTLVVSPNLGKSKSVSGSVPLRSTSRNVLVNNIVSVKSSRSMDVGDPPSEKSEFPRRSSVSTEHRCSTSCMISLKNTSGSDSDASSRSSPALRALPPWLGLAPKTASSVSTGCRASSMVLKSAAQPGSSEPGPIARRASMAS